MPVRVADVILEYDKNKNLKKQDIEILQQWLEKQPHLPKVSELQLILFLHSCYYKIEATKTTIDAFFTLKTHFTDVFANRDPYWPRTMESMDCGIFVQLPKRTPEGYRIIFFTIIDGDASKFVLTDHMKLFDMCLRLWLHEDGTAEGLVIVGDMKKLSFGHIARLGIFSIKHFFAYLQEALPVRLKGLHLINVGAAAEKLMSICKPFIKEELNSVLHLHANVSDSFFKFVPQDCLPEDFGGTTDPIKDLVDVQRKKIFDNADYFIEDEKLVCDESKRIEKLNNFIAIDYGLDGSFKKLEID